MVKKLVALALAACCAAGLCACAGEEGKSGSSERAPLSYYDGLDPEKGVNNNLFYQNLAQFGKIADPGCIYITEGEEKGYFYAYGTSDELSTRGFFAVRSDDLTNWETVGAAFLPEMNSWGIEYRYWAPEVIYYKTPEQKENGEPGKYYMYYSTSPKANSKNATGEVDRSSNLSGEYHESIGVAVSDSPNGPFVQWTGINGDGENIADESIIPFTHLSDRLWEMRSPDNTTAIRAYDVSPFIDSKGDLYLYFASEVKSPGCPQIFGMKMKDPVTPDYDTLTFLVAYGKTSIDEDADDFYYDRLNESTNYRCIEAPYMYERNGVYYLTYSANLFRSKVYCVNLAVGTFPLGKFVKPAVEQGNPLLFCEPHWDFSSGTGHHSFVQAGEQLYMVYHEHMNRAGGDGTRALGSAEVVFRDGGGSVKIKQADATENTLNFDMMHINGPSDSVQALPEIVSGYKNLAGKATIEATNIIAGKTQFLNDGVVTYHDYTKVSGNTVAEGEEDLYNLELVAKSSTEITLTFDKAVSVRAIMVKNSIDYYKAFKEIDSVEFYLAETIKDEKGKEFSGIFYIDDLKCNDNFVNTEIGYMHGGGGAIAEFAPIKVNKIVLKISKKYTDKDAAGNLYDQIALSDICVLGEDVSK